MCYYYWSTLIFLLNYTLQFHQRLNRKRNKCRWVFGWKISNSVFCIRIPIAGTIQKALLTLIYLGMHKNESSGYSNSTLSVPPGLIFSTKVTIKRFLPFECIVFNRKTIDSVPCVGILIVQNPGKNLPTLLGSANRTSTYLLTRFLLKKSQSTAFD